MSKRSFWPGVRSPARWTPRSGRKSPSPPPGAPASAEAAALINQLFGWKQPPPLHLRPWSSLATLESKRQVSKDSTLLEFTIGSTPAKADESQPLLLPGQYLLLSPAVQLGDAAEERPYTPVDVSGNSVTLLVKTYHATSASDIKGAFSRWLTTELKIGQQVRLRGPFGAVALALHTDRASTTAEGVSDSSSASLYLSSVGVALPVRRLALVAGGSGVTPVAQMLNAACARLERSGEAVDTITASNAAKVSVAEASTSEASPGATAEPLYLALGSTGNSAGDASTAASTGASTASSTASTATTFPGVALPGVALHAVAQSAPISLEISVLVSDHTPSHALLTEELDSLARRHPALITSLHRTFTSLPAGESSPGGSGARRVDGEMLAAHLPPPSDDTVVLVCGPAGFEASVHDHLKELGHVHTVLLSSGEIDSPAVSAALLAAHRLLMPFAAALRCCLADDMEERSSGRWKEEGGAPAAVPRGGGGAVMEC